MNQAYAASWKTYVHDHRGNVTNNGRGITFNYDSANQPISMGGNVSASYVYDGNLKRASQNQNGERIYSFYTQGAGLLATFNAQTDTLTEFVRAGGETLARIESDGGDLFVAAENAIPPTETNAASGDILWRKAYKPYGESLNEPMDATTLDYIGHIRDDSGLVYMQARYYDPVVGRFLSNDPVGAGEYLNEGNIQGVNRYTYASNNPYKFIDPDGRKIKLAAGPKNAQELLNAVNYLSADPSFVSNLNRLEASNDTYHLKVHPSNPSKYDPKTKTILWSPTEGLRVKGGVQSPALGLAHEIDHAAEHDKNGSLPTLKNGKETPATIAEEKRALANENKTAKILGEPGRATRHSGTVEQVKSSTYSCVKKQNNPC